MKIRRVTAEDKKELAKLIKNFETCDYFLSDKQRKIRAFTDGQFLQVPLGI